MITPCTGRRGTPPMMSALALSNDIHTHPRHYACHSDRTCLDGIDNTKGRCVVRGPLVLHRCSCCYLGCLHCTSPAPLFLFDAASATAISMLAVMSVNWNATRPEGLLGLGHLFSLPGAFIGVLVTAIVAKKKVATHPFVLFLFGFGGLLVGYFLNQLVVCNTVMWCGPLSLPLK